MQVENVVVVHELPCQPQSGQFVRRLLVEHARLEPLRLAEAQLVATELIRHFLDQEERSDIEVRLVADVTDWRVVMTSKKVKKPLEAVSHALLDGLSRRWGEESDETSTTYWFEVKAAGTGEALVDVSNHDLLLRASSDPLYQDEAVRRFTPLSAAIARRFRDKGIPDRDLEQVALLGLVSAMRRFDPEKGEFEPFAAVTIVGELKRYLRDKAWSVRVPRGLQESTLNVGKTIDRLTQTFGRIPTAAEIAADIGLAEEEVSEAQEARVAYRWESIDAPDPNTGLALAELLPGAGDDDLWPELADELARLPEREREIVYLRFFEDLTQSEIAERVGVSQMHVSRLLQKALGRLRSVLESHPVE
jgi:RNA polymerase sigma-B factor